MANFTGTIVSGLGISTDNQARKILTLDTITNFDGRRVYSRVKVYKTKKGIYRAKSTGSQSSGVLTSMSLANGLAICPEFTDKIKKGQIVQVEMFDWAENTF